MGFRRFWSRIFLQTGLKPPEVASSAPNADVPRRLSRLEKKVGRLKSAHRKDKLELLDIHERVKTSLAKLNRRAREAQPDETADSSPGAEVQPVQLQSTSRHLISRRGIR